MGFSYHVLSYNHAPALFALVIFGLGSCFYAFNPAWTKTLLFKIFFSFFFFFFVVPGFELRAHTLSHSTNPFFFFL
jgi:hypothetical protein